MSDKALKLVFGTPNPQLSAQNVGRGVLAFHLVCTAAGGARGLAAGLGEYFQGWRKRPRLEIKDPNWKRFEGVYNSVNEALQFVKAVAGGGAGGAGAVFVWPVIVPWLWWKEKAKEA